MLSAFSVCMVKTITIADDVYEELIKMKGNKSFSELLRELIRERKGNAEVLIKIFGSLSREEVDELEKRIKEIEKLFEKWGRFLIHV